MTKLAAERQRFAARLLLDLPEAGQEPVSTNALGDHYQLEQNARIRLLWSSLDQLTRLGLAERVVRGRDRHWRRTPMLTQLLAALPQPTDDAVSTSDLTHRLAHHAQQGDTLDLALNCLAHHGLAARAEGEHTETDRYWRRTPAGNDHAQQLTTTPAPVPDRITVVELIGSPKSGSRSRALADATVEALITAGVIHLNHRHILELAQIAAVTFTAAPAVASHPVADPFATLRAADLLIVATPTSAGTYTGLLKTCLDHLVDRLGPRQLTGTVAIPVAVATCHQHLATVSKSLTTLLTALSASVPAPPLVLHGPQDPRPAATRWAAQHATAIGRTLADARALPDQPSAPPQPVS